MTEREQVEEQVREVLATETQAITLSDKLFSPNGLFSQLAGTLEERRALVRSPLFTRAQDRFRELQYQEAAAFAQTVQHARAALPEGSYRVKLERSEEPFPPVPLPNELPR
jgi:hypothetical protein